MKQSILLFLTLLLSACDSGTSSKTPEEIQAEVEASQKKFAEERARIEREQKAYEAKLSHQRSFISVRFVSVSDSVLEVELTNKTDKDIDNVMGSLQVQDEAGNIVTSTGLTIWIPGEVYLPAGQSQRVTKSLKLDRPDDKAKLLSSAQSLNYSFTLMRYQNVGEDEVNLENPDADLPPMIQPQAEPAIADATDPLEQANPSACPAGQETKFTPKEYYPGPKCEHISRNLDAEVHKKEYMLICTGGKFEPWMVSPVASVQIASCKRDLNSNGIFYYKQLCCQEPS